MIKCNLSLLMGKYRETIQSVHEKTGLNRNTISNLYHEKVKRIDFDTLEKLCILFDCQPGDILEYIPISNALQSQPVSQQDKDSCLVSMER